MDYVKITSLNLQPNVERAGSRVLGVAVRRVYDNHGRSCGFEMASSTHKRIGNVDVVLKNRLIVDIDVIVGGVAKVGVRQTAGRSYLNIYITFFECQVVCINGKTG